MGGDSTVTVDLKLVGGVQETVTVESPPIAIQFASSSTQLTVENKLVDQLPVRGRNPYNVVNLRFDGFPRYRFHLKRESTLSPCLCE